MNTTVTAEKKDEKVEKRKALGRGLASLLPGPRAVASGEPRVAESETKVPRFARDDKNGVGRDGENGVELDDRNGAERDHSGLTSTAMGAPSESTSPPSAKDAKDGAPTPEEQAGEVISIQAQADPRYRAHHQIVSPLAVDLIDKNPYQTRYVFDEDMLLELADSIKENGVVQPVVVRPGEDGRFILVLGERRLRASKMAGQERSRQS